MYITIVSIQSLGLQRTPINHYYYYIIIIIIIYYKYKHQPLPLESEVATELPAVVILPPLICSTVLPAVSNDPGALLAISDLACSGALCRRIDWPPVPGRLVGSKMTGLVWLPGAPAGAKIIGPF